MFIEEDMHNKIASKECKDYDIIIVDKIRQIIHDTDFKELTQGYKDQIYNQLDNLDTHQNVEIVQQVLEQIMQEVTTKIQSVNAKYHDDQTNLRIYVNYTEPKTTRDMYGEVSSVASQIKNRPSFNTTQVKNTLDDIWNVGWGIFGAVTAFTLAAEVLTIGAGVVIGSSMIGLVSSIGTSHIVQNVGNKFKTNNNASNIFGWLGIGTSISGIAGAALDVVSPAKLLGGVAQLAGHFFVDPIFS